MSVYVRLTIVSSLTDGYGTIPLISRYVTDARNPISSQYIK